MLESICGWEKLDNRRGFHFDRQRLILGDEPPQRSVIGEWLNWIDSAGLPHSVFGGTGARNGHSQTLCDRR
jgi:hypothetical protein